MTMTGTSARGIKAASLSSKLDNILTQIGGTQRAKRAAEQGNTSHPSEGEDDRTQPAEEGFRSSENSTDVKEDVGAVSIDSTPEDVTKDQDSVQPNIGLQSSATGEDSSIETASATGKKDDPGSDHPARVDNEALDDHKYASQLVKLAMQTRHSVKRAGELGNDVLALYTVEANVELQKRAADVQAQRRGESPAAKTAAATAATTAAPAVDPQLGAYLGHFNLSDKQAADQQVITDLTVTMKQALDMADKTAAYLLGHKNADDEHKPEDKPADKGGDSGPPSDGGGAPPPPADAGAGGGGQPSDQDMLAMLAGGGGGDPAAAAGGAPPAAGPAGMPGDPAAAGGAPGGQPNPQDLQALAMALAQVGITPEMLQAASAPAGPAGAPGGAPGGTPGGAPGAPKMASHGTVPGKAKTAEEQLVASTVNRINELLGRRS